jgi:hypothetical protein
MPADYLQEFPSKYVMHLPKLVHEGERFVMCRIDKYGQSVMYTGMTHGDMVTRINLRSRGAGTHNFAHLKRDASRAKGSRDLYSWAYSSKEPLDITAVLDTSSLDECDIAAEIAQSPVVTR